ncbi:YciI family protein [Nonomuraea dietziae]|uniref:YciI family protein n=1 Tax=Nonomuraea dietziae TaxID=65515 RepID=UPI00340B0DA3
MKFLLNLYLNAADPPGEGLDHEGFLAESGQAGELISAHAFADPSLSTAVRVRGGVVAVTDGPYLPTSEHVAGQYVVDCESRERAVELATLLSSGHACGVEVRPLMDSAGMEM